MGATPTATTVFLSSEKELCLDDFLVFKEKDVSLNRTNTVIIADSNNHTVFGYIDTENLPNKKRDWEPQHIK